MYRALLVSCSPVEYRPCVCWCDRVCVCTPKNRQTHSSAVCIARIPASPICWAPFSTLQNYKWLWDSNTWECKSWINVEATEVRLSIVVLCLCLFVMNIIQMMFTNRPLSQSYLIRKVSPKSIQSHKKLRHKQRRHPWLSQNDYTADKEENSHSGWN